MIAMFLIGALLGALTTGAVLETLRLRGLPRYKRNGGR